MLLGYHYTTRDRWESISQHGLFPHPIRQHELERFRLAMPLMPDEAVWVWQEPLSPRAALVVSILLGELRDDFDLVLIEVQYESQDAMSVNFREKPTDTVNLSCSFEAGGLKTGDRPIELLYRHIPPERLKIVWHGDLLAVFDGIHLEAKCDDTNSYSSEKTVVS